MALSAIVVVPARDEEDQIAGCLQALGEQTIARDAFTTIIVLDGCTDATEAVARATAGRLGLTVSFVLGPGEGAGAARRAGLDGAAAQLLGQGMRKGLIACTDADSRPAPDWLAAQLAHIRAGARAVAGLVDLDPEESVNLPATVLLRRQRDAAARLRRVRSVDPAAAHHHFAGASIGVTAEVYRRVGGMAPLVALEDAAFAQRLVARGIPILRAADVRVRTSARSSGRAVRGLAVDLAVSRWLDERRYRAGDFSLQLLRARKGATSVCAIIPTKQCAQTIAGVITHTVGPLRDAGLIDELLVIDADSPDGTADAARAAGARVVDQDDVLSEFGPALGKGDAMWRAVHATSSDIVCFLDGDTADPHPNHLRGLLGPLLVDPAVVLVKGAFDRPLRTTGATLPHEGGRVTELMARPLLNLHEPRLAGFSQPLAGEFSARRGVLESVAFPAGYGVEIAVLIDALRGYELDALAECQLGSRQNRHQPLRDLGEMAYAVLAAVERRLPGRTSVAGGHYLQPWRDGEVVQVPVSERPPLRTLALELVNDPLASDLVP
jgi:glucosyl-3-phosphoglycerate synthase